MKNRTQTLARKTPYFIFKPKILEKNFSGFKNSCEKCLGKGKYVIAYSIKTNSYNGVIEKLNELGSSFEVASLDEIELTDKIRGNIDDIWHNEINEVKKKQSSEVKLYKNQRFDINNKNYNKLIVFNGPCKTKEELELVIKNINNNFLINVDSRSEINKIVSIINKLKGKSLGEVNIGLRVSLNESKFGFSVDSLEELENIIDYCKKINLNIICLSFHEGTQLSINKFENNINKIEEIVSKLKGKFKLDNLKYIDIGGGFPDNIQLKNLGVSLENYFKLIEKYARKFDLIVILEPGRTLVSDALELIAKVNVIKENFGKNYAILDVGINVLSKITLANYKFSKINDFDNSLFNKVGEENQTDQPSKVQTPKSIRLSAINIKNNYLKEKKEYILTGPLLFRNDILGKFYGNLKEGDLIRIENVGAYCYNLAWEISYKKPEVFNEYTIN